MKQDKIKFAPEFRAELSSILGNMATRAFVEKTKAAIAAGEDTGTFECVVSTADVDRYGEVVDQSGWDLSYFKTNPVVLWGHDYYALPIGICDSIEVVGGKLVAKGRFASAEANPLAQQIRKLYDAGIVRATSVGFIVHETEGNTITKAELLEFSFVSIPANPHALTVEEAKALGMNTTMLSIKGFEFAEKKDGEAAADPQPETPAADPAPETPAADPAPETPTEEKGAVADEIDAEAAWEAKWQNLDPLLDIIDAMICVYLDEATPVEQFKALVDEMVSLIATMSSGTAPTTTSIKAMIEKRAAEKISAKFVLRRKDASIAQQIGAELAAIQSEVDGSITAHAKNILAIAAADDAEDVSTQGFNNGGSSGKNGVAATEEKTGEAPAPKSSVDPSGRTGGETVVREHDKFHTARAAIREMLAVGTEALTTLNKSSGRNG